ncbi:MAG TPA: cytochrome P450 [Acidimicrobiia bacterium]|jgi:cytochrome P450
MTSSPADALYWDPFEPELRDDPYPLWRRLRDEAPVWHNERHDFWVLSRFADVEAAHRDVATYSSAHGILIDRMTAAPVESGMIIVNDPPRHTVLRALVSRAFTPRRIAILEERIRTLCRDLLEAQRGNNEFDYVQDFGAIVPPTVISMLLGIPDVDQETLRHQVDQLFHIEDGPVNDTAIHAAIELHEYLSRLLDERRLHPGDDMLSSLTQAEITDGGHPRPLSQDEAIEFAILLFTAGTETVARLLGWTGFVLAAHPHQRAEMVADPSLIPGAIEELLRYEAPSPVQGRFTTRDVDLYGQTIPGGSTVALLTGSAGRDDRKYEAPDRFDIRRRIELHLGFGYGIHFCLGATLARVEGRIALEETLAVFPEWEVDRANAELLYTHTVRGYKRLPIRV